MNKFWLNSFGRLIFQNKVNKYLFAERKYRNVDHVIYIDDSRGFCENVGSGKFTEFKEDEWVPVSRDEFNMIKKSYRELVLIKQAIRLNIYWNTMGIVS